VGSGVLELKRTAFGPLELGALPAGRWRELGQDEVAALRRAAR
jgi:16S rRNA U516 pseudouridylate synthase RsuA-like enzyme